MTVAAVPVKDLENAKQRLIPILTPVERATLARAMLADVLRALSGARLDEVWVVTRDPEVALLARGFRCRVLDEDANLGHTAAARRAQAAAAEAGARVFVTVPGDVPCVTPSEIDALVAAVGAGRGAPAPGPGDLTAPAVAFAPSRSGLGTNGAALVPPDVLPLRFGEPSFEDHLAAARLRGLAPAVLSLRGLGLDVDDAADLGALLAEGAGTESGRLVAGWSLAERLGAALAAGATARAPGS